MRSFIYMRASPLDKRPITVQVDAPDKDKAVARLAVYFPYVELTDWDFIEEVDIEAHTIGKMGQHLKWPTLGAANDSRYRVH